MWGGVCSLVGRGSALRLLGVNAGLPVERPALPPPRAPRDRILAGGLRTRPAGCDGGLPVPRGALLSGVRLGAAVLLDGVHPGPPGEAGARAWARGNTAARWGGPRRARQGLRGQV